MFETVRVRVTVWYSVVLAIILLIFSLTSYFLFAKATESHTDADLAELANSFLVTLQDENQDTEAGGLQGAARQAMLEHRVADTTLAIADASGDIVVTPKESASHPDSESRAIRLLSSDEVRSFLKAALKTDRSYRTISGSKGGFRAYAQRFSANGKTWLALILRSLHSQAEMLSQIRLAFAWLIPLGVALAATGGYFLARKSLAPVAAMGIQAERLGAANLHQRLEVRNANDELGRLAKTFNELLDRLDQSFERQRRFIADASHELRTPISILRGEAEVALSQPSRPPEEYRESLSVLHHEAQRLSRIVEDLFTLTRADAGEYQLSRTDFYLDELVADCVRATRALAGAKNTTLAVATPDEMPVNADEDLLRRMILNLLDNAIKYTPAGGNVSVTSHSLPGGYELNVTDTGPGIPESMRSRIFERFFRADVARSRAEKDGGAGLGLSIARWIAEAHLGRIELIRSDATGSTFTVYIPAANKPSPS